MKRNRALGGTNLLTGGGGAVRGLGGTCPTQPLLLKEALINWGIDLRFPLLSPII